MKLQNLIQPIALAIIYLVYIFTTPADLDISGYGLGLFFIFALAAKAMNDDTDKYFVLVGYLFWNVAYVMQIYYAYDLKLSNWPLFTGAYYLMNEAITCFTNRFENPAQDNYVTPTYVRYGYYVFFALDLMLNVMTIVYGTGSDYDELNLFPMKTMEQRAAAFAIWSMFWYFTQINLASTFGPRQAKYSMAAFQYVCQSSLLRLPVWGQIATHAGLSNAMKLQTFGSAFYVVRIKSPSDPKFLLRSLLFFMSPFCAVSATAINSHIRAVEEGLFAKLAIAWLMMYWVVVIGMSKISPSPKSLEAEASAEGNKVKAQ